MPKPGCHFHPGISDSAVLSAAVAASGLKAARARTGLRYGTLEPALPMPRETPKRGDRKGQSTDAGGRVGTARRSGEAPVTGVERRGRVIRLSATGSTPIRRGRNP
jgi:hypothetical protein